MKYNINDLLKEYNCVLIDNKDFDNAREKCVKCGRYKKTISLSYIHTPSTSIKFDNLQICTRCES